jgi:hypothetical protein
MDFSAHAGAVLGYFPFVVAIPAGIAVVCNHIDAAKRHPKVIYTACGLLSLRIAFLLSRLPGTAFRGVNLGVAGVLASLCFVVAYLRATDILTKKAAALLWREIFLLSFATFNLYFAWTDWKSGGYIVIVALCASLGVQRTGLSWAAAPRKRSVLSGHCP